MTQSQPSKDKQRDSRDKSVTPVGHGQLLRGDLDRFEGEGIDSPGDEEMFDSARRWAAIDPDPDTKRQVLEAVAAGDVSSIRRWFGPRLEFGTAGLRGPLGPGPASINRVVGRQVAEGFAHYLLGAVGDVAEAPLVVVGFDGRHKSESIAVDAVDIFQNMGFDVYFIAEPAPTPLAAWAIRSRRAAGGFVVTASHNPPGDNGIKVYGIDGAQIIPPADIQIADEVKAVAAATRPESKSARPPGTLIPFEPADRAAYLDWIRQTARLATEKQTHRKSDSAQYRPIRVAYTALHGVGYDLANTAMTELAEAELFSVFEQQVPHPDFPGLAFPNPEERGALDRLRDQALADGADLAIANDPDADRCAVLLPSRSPGEGFVALTGDQVGWILAAREMSAGVGELDLFVTTVVSSQLLQKMCDSSGATWRETLTGFKWLCRPSLADSSLVPRLAYEEALGYALGDALDKDGICAAAAIVAFAAELRARGLTLWSVLDDLRERFGLHETRSFSVRTKARVQIPFPVDEPEPETFGGLPVFSVDRPDVDVVRLHLAGGHRVALRPSGTEPKFKVYLEAVGQVGWTRGESERLCASVLDRLEHESLELIGG